MVRDASVAVALVPGHTEEADVVDEKDDRLDAVLAGLFVSISKCRLWARFRGDGDCRLLCRPPAEGAAAAAADVVPPKSRPTGTMGTGAWVVGPWVGVVAPVAEAAEPGTP